MKNGNPNAGMDDGGSPAVSSVELLGSSGRALNLNKMTLEELKSERRRLVPILREWTATIEDAKRFMSAHSLIQFMNTAVQQANEFNAGRRLDGTAFVLPLTIAVLITLSGCCSPPADNENLRPGEIWPVSKSVPILMEL